LRFYQRNLNAERMEPRDSMIPQRLPALTLNGPAGAVPLRAPAAGSRVLLLVRDADLERARPFIAMLEQSLPELRDWYADALLVTEHATPETALPVANAEHDAWSALGVRPGENALIIADRWGEVYFARQARSFTDWPPPPRIEEWVRFLAMQCPECGVIDEPGYGEWAP
jgi:hypothetical protein